jgi:hypothetical protein
MRPSCNATCHGDSSSSSSNFFAVGSRKECSLSLRRWQRNHISCHAMTCMCKCMLGVSVRPLGRGALSVQHACQQARMCVRTHPLALAQLSCLIQLLYATNQRLKVRKEGGWAVLCQVQQNLWGAIGVGNSLAAGEVTEQGPDAEQQVGSGGQLARASCNQGTHNTVLLMCVCAQSTTKHAYQGAHMHTHARTLAMLIRAIASSFQRVSTRAGGGNCPLCSRGMTAMQSKDAATSGTSNSGRSDKKRLKASRQRACCCEGWWNVERMRGNVSNSTCDSHCRGSQQWQ